VKNPHLTRNRKVTSVIACFRQLAQGLAVPDERSALQLDAELLQATGETGVYLLPFFEGASGSG